MRGAARRLLALLALGGAALAPAADVDDAPVVVVTHDVAVREQVAYVGRTRGLEILDVALPSRPEPLALLPLDATVLGVTLVGDRALLAAGAHGMLVVDVTDPAAPRLRTRFDATGKVRRIAVAGEYALLAASRHGLSVVRLSDPSRPLQVATVGTSGDLQSLSLDGDRLATAEGHAGVRLFDVARPDNPREIARLDRPAEGARDVLLVGDRLLVAAGSRGLLVFDLGDGAPRQVGAIELDGRATTLAEHDGGVLVGAGSAGLHRVDLRGPQGPARVDGLRLPGSLPVGRMHAAGGMVYLAAGAAGPAIVDLSAAPPSRVLWPRESKPRISIR